MVSSSALVQAQVVDPSNTLLTPMETESMGRSLLVEEVTTTWCPSCAQIDPYLRGVADSHGSRIAMVAYHPSDGEDAFQPPAAQHRINRLGLLHGDAIPSPTFFVEGKNPRSGTEAWNDVQRDILDLELTRQDTTLLQFEVLRTADGITARVLSFGNMSVELENTQLTFLVLEHQKTVPDGFVNPGEPTRDRVLVATAECDMNTSTITTQLGLASVNVNQGCMIDFEIMFNDMTEFSILLIHESTENAILNSEASLGTYGAVEFAYRSRDIPESWSLANVLLLVAAGAGLIAIWPRKN
ncbi:MAG: hypothetical protein OSA21_06240 [Candidatus Poseidoniaceae archaeon]|nr:hypothetical protein [Candidatus Poseidoniaceae archaeon]